MTTIPPVFTVFTATYNRSNTLPRVYAGLRSQTYQNFEWLVIDDGSSDGTDKLIEQWRREASFPIRYFWQENRGKHIAHNRALDKARGTFFIVLDSDDGVFPVALERLLSLWESIPEAQREDFCGAAALCMDQDGHIVGQELPAAMMDASLLEMRFIHKRSQEFFSFYLLDILKRYPFPEIEGVHFIPEGVVWSQIGQKYKTRYLNEPLRIYYVETDTGNLMRSPPAQLAASHSYWHQFMLNQEITWFRYAPFHFLLSAAHYIRFSLHKGTRFKQQLEGLKNQLARWLWLCMLPLGMGLFFGDKWRER